MAASPAPAHSTDRDSGIAAGLRNAIQRVAHGFGYHVARLPLEHTRERYLSRLLATLDVNCVLDVGAHFGEFYQTLREIGYAGWIISFEPVPESFAALCHTTHGDGRWRGLNVALGLERGTLRINVPESTGFASFLEPNAYCAQQFPHARWSGQSIEVRVESLSGIYAELVAEIEQPRVFLKMDTQGWDSEVLEGAHTMMGNVVALQSEVSVQPLYSGMRDFGSSIRHYKALGFQLGAMFPVTYDASGLRVIEFDCVMLSRPDV